MENKWQKRAAKAQQETDAELSKEMNALSSFNPPGLNELLAEYNMDNKDFTQLMKIVKDHTKSNNDKAKSSSDSWESYCRVPLKILNFALS